MKHDWKIEEVDGGAIGMGEFLRCQRCYASGGPPDFRLSPFITCGCGLAVTEDCDEAEKLIMAHQRTCPFGPCAPGQQAFGFARRHNAFWSAWATLKLTQLTEEAEALGLYEQDFSPV